MDDLPPELIVDIAAICDVASAVVFKHVGKRYYSFIHPTASPQDIMVSAARNGHSRVISWLYSIGYTPKKVILGDNRNSIIGSSINLDVGAYDTGEICEQAVRGGHLATLKILQHLGFKMNNSAMNYAAIRRRRNDKNIQLVKYCSIAADWTVEYHTMLIAAALGDINLLEWIYTEFGIAKWELPLVCMASATGQINVLKWARRKYEIILSTMNVSIAYAAYNGHIGAVQWLLSEGLKPIHAITGATVGGRQNVIKWVLHNYPKLRGSIPGIWTADPMFDVNSPQFVLNKYKL